MDSNDEDDVATLSFYTTTDLKIIHDSLTYSVLNIAHMVGASPVAATMIVIDMLAMNLHKLDRDTFIDYLDYLKQCDPEKVGSDFEMANKMDEMITELNIRFEKKASDMAKDMKGRPDKSKLH